jgi:hypothetical protein
MAFELSGLYLHGKNEGFPLLRLECPYAEFIHIHIYYHPWMVHDIGLKMMLNDDGIQK